MLLTHYDDVNTITITTFFTFFHIFSIFLLQGKTEIKQLYTKLRLFQTNCVDIGYLRFLAVIKHKIKLKMLTKLLFQLQKRALIH